MKNKVTVTINRLPKKEIFTGIIIGETNSFYRVTVVPIDDLFSFFNGNHIAEASIHNDTVHCSAIRLLEQV